VHVLRARRENHTFRKTHCTNPACPALRARSAADGRGVRVVTNVVRNAVEGLCRGTCGMVADGEVVWSWRAHAGAQVGDDANASRWQRWQTLVHRGARNKPVNHCAGKAGLSRRYLWSTPRAFLSRGGHGCGQHPAFPAPSRLKRALQSQQLGRFAPRECGPLSRLADFRLANRIA
jgi:hypothetical protein